MTFHRVSRRVSAIVANVVDALIDDNWDSLLQLLLHCNDLLSICSFLAPIVGPANASKGCSALHQSGLP
jgi:hypothetical protein